MKNVDMSKNDLIEQLCNKNQIDFIFLKSLLESVKIKKLIKRNNYHTNKIIEVIENEIK